MSTRNALDPPGAVAAAAGAGAVAAAAGLAAAAPAAAADEIFALFRRRGAAAYFGEGVSTTDHSLQTAQLARQAGAPPTLVLAALLHDVGHLIDAAPDDIAAWRSDGRHEVSGGAWLALRLPPAVHEPVRLHVRAKRYLCATDPVYWAELSEASKLTLRLQGGPLSRAEVAEFEAEPRHREALLLRRCDDGGKVAGLEVPPLEAYRGLIESLTRARE